jgi:hypothetical protein
MLSKDILIELKDYVQEHIIVAPIVESSEFIQYSHHVSDEICNNELENFINSKRKPTLNEVLFSFIDQKGVSDAEVYKKAGIDRKHFSKIRSNPNYRIGKNSAIALALALELNKKDTEKLLSSAGFSLSDSDTFDLVIQFCLEKKIYNLYDVNLALEYFDLKPLSG